MILVDGSEKRGCFDDLVISNAQNEDWTWFNLPKCVFNEDLTYQNDPKCGFNEDLTDQNVDLIWFYRQKMGTSTQDMAT
jgi:hypothetical protein